MEALEKRGGFALQMGRVKMAATAAEAVEEDAGITHGWGLIHWLVYKQFLEMF